MNQATMMLSVAAVALWAGSPALAMDTAKGTLMQVVPVPNSESTSVFGINATGASGVITGSWIDPSGVEHGYFGPANGSGYTTFDDPNSPKPGTQPRGINDNGYITGFSNSRSKSESGYIPWERDPSGNITEITQSGTLLNDVVQGINNKKNEFAGGYIDSSLESTGYLGANGVYKQAVDLSGIANTGYAARGIDNKGDIVGWYYDSRGVQHGFLITGGTAQQLDPDEPNLASNVLEGINDKNTVTGFWTDTSGFIHGYFYNVKKKKFHNLKIPGSSTFVEAFGIDDLGDVAVDSDAGNFIYYPAGRRLARMQVHGSYKQTTLVKPKPQLP